MDRDSTTLLLLALMVVGGTFGMRRSSDGAGDKSPEGVDKRDQAESGYGSPATAAVDLIGRFFDSRDPTGHAAGWNADADYCWSAGESSLKISLKASAVSDQDDLARALPRLRELRRLSKEKHVDVEFMIATVPDPIDAHPGWESDPMIDAIQRAFEANGFFLDRFYFPWQGYTPKPTDPSKLALPLHVRYPSVVLFRSGTVVPSPTENDLKSFFTAFHNPKLYVVLLVGETPTRGIHKIALAHALDVVAAWEAPGEATEALKTAPDVVAAWQSRPLWFRILKGALARALESVAGWKWEAAKKVTFPRTINTAAWHPLALLWEAVKQAASPRLQVKILGPSFSGSTVSLRNALEEWVSGESGVRAIKAHMWSSIEFKIVSGSAQDLRNKPTLQFKLPKPKGEQGKDWRTREVQSTFHSTMVPSVAFNKCVFTNYLEKRNNVDRRQIALLTEANTVYGENASRKSEPEEGSPDQQPLILHYPMQIGRLRAAYERERALQPQGAEVEQGPPRRHLDLRLEENPTANDLLPAFSQVAETSVAAVMEDMLAALGRSGIRYLGIIGTDPMDVLFLARLAHRACPDAQLFTTDGDLLFTHSAYRVYTEGMLVFSAYPLFIKSQAWMPRPPYPREGRQFSDSRAEGTFNANCSLLAPHGAFQSVDYATPFKLQSQVTKPAVWCLVVSNGALWPVECYPWDNAPGDESPSYNDAVDTLIRDEYVSRLGRIRKRPDGETAESWEKKLKERAQDWWGKESEHYSFDDTSLGTDKEYILGRRPSQDERDEEAKRKPWNATQAELALGLDGFLGFVSLILSTFSVVNCAQYFAGIRPFRVSGPLVRWSLFYIPDTSGRCPIVAQASCYRFYFFAMLWLAQVAVMSPLLAGTYFRIDWTHGLHPRHRCILINELTAVFAITCVIVIDGLRIRSQRLGKVAKGPVGKTPTWGVVLRWPVLLGLLLAVPAACVLAWLCGLYYPWCSARGVLVVSVALLMGLLFVKGIPAPVCKIAWPWVFVFLLVVATVCVLAWQCGLCSPWPLGLGHALVVVIASALGLLVVKEAALMKLGERLDQAAARLRPVVPALLLGIPGSKWVHRAAPDGIF